MSATEQARAIWAACDAMKREAQRLEQEARDLRNEAGRLSNIAAAIADGRPVAKEIVRAAG